MNGNPRVWGRSVWWIGLAWWMLIGVGCAALRTPHLAEAERALTGSFVVADNFLQWESAQVEVSEEVRQVATAVRENYPRIWMEAVRVLREWRQRGREPADWVWVQRQLDELIQVVLTVYPEETWKR